MRIFFDHNTRNIGFFEPVVYLKKGKLTGLRSFLWNVGEFADRMCYLGDSTTYIAESASITYFQAKIKPMSCYSLADNGGIKNLFFKVSKAVALLFLFPLLLLFKLYYKACCVEGYLVTDKFLFDAEMMGRGIKTKEDVLRLAEGLSDYFEGIKLPWEINEPFSYASFKEWVEAASLDEGIGYLAALELSLIVSLSSRIDCGQRALISLSEPQGEGTLLENIFRIAAHAWGRLLTDADVLALDDLAGPISPFSRLALTCFLNASSASSIADRKRVIKALQLYDITMSGSDRL